MEKEKLCDADMALQGSEWLTHEVFQSVAKVLSVSDKFLCNHYAQFSFFS